MRFLVDAQLPRLLAICLNELGHSARHTLDLTAGNHTPDTEIASMADRHNAVVITKDADFIDSHLLSGCPSRLLLVSTGNISNRRLLGLFETQITQIASAFAQSHLIELHRDGLVIHD
jgi:predicted nuclease of predicted toxin-antitoxin system